MNLKYPGQRFLALLGMTGSRLLLDYYYEKMGWDKQTGKPLPETLKKLGLEHIIKDLENT